ncbi:MAG TPA: hypothetical protein VF778_05965 [Xanthobacteraceae bacterium]
MGVLGQGIRAAVGLKSLSALPQQGVPSQQSTFSAAYFCLSLMIGFIAGVLAGIAVGLNKLLTIDVNNLKTLLGIAVAGYAGADFIENTLSIVIPGTAPPQSGPPTSRHKTPKSPHSPRIRRRCRVQYRRSVALLPPCQPLRQRHRLPPHCVA